MAVSIQGVFREYERLTVRSGLTLNASKTELMIIYDGMNGLRDEREYEIEYMNDKVKIKAIDELKICGIWYCRDRDRQYKLNILDKIGKPNENVEKQEFDF